MSSDPSQPGEHAEPAREYPPGTLASVVAVEPIRAEVVGKCLELINGEVSSKTGLSGVAIKGAYGTVKRIKPRFVSEVIDSLLDEWLEKIEPTHQSWRASGQGSFESYVSERADEVAENLLSVTDKRAEAKKTKTTGKLYFKMRPRALANVSIAVPKLGKLIESYL